MLLLFPITNEETKAQSRGAVGFAPRSTGHESQFSEPLCRILSQDSMKDRFFLLNIPRTFQPSTKLFLGGVLSHLISKAALGACSHFESK